MCARPVAVDGNRNNGGEEAMLVSSSKDFAWWDNFPKGLRILLLDHDDASAADTKLKLEKMDYIVSMFSNEKEALEAISSRTESFHVAIVEVNGSDKRESFRFLETARGLPTVMVSDGSCLNTMMKCLALGAAEVLEKPLLEEKVKNIWQHVAHKAFNAGGSSMPKSSLDYESTEESKGSENPSAQEGLPSPSTPQLERGICDSRDSIGPSSYSSADHDSEGKDAGDFTFGCCSESKSVDNTCNGSNDPKECAISSDSKSGHQSLEPGKEEPNPKHVSSVHGGRKNGKKKMKVDWTPDLHRRFVQAIEQLGIDQAIPSKILELMKVEGLTRHNIASHLQKYRMQRKSALPKDGDRSWLHRRDSLRVYANKTVMAMRPPPKSNYGYSQVYPPAWGYPQFPPSGSQMWGYPGSYPWHQGSWPWKSQTRMYADAWGCPVFSQKNDYHASTTAKIVQNVPPNKIILDPNRGGWNLQEPQLREDVIDGVVKEAISKPWLPLPIGLKPPSTDCVLSELQRQGICSIPPN